MNSYKVVLVGNSGIGKTSFVRNLIGHDAGSAIGNLERGGTLGVDVNPYHVPNSHVVLNIWDVGCNPKYQSMRKGYYTDANLVVIMYEHIDEVTAWEIEAKSTLGEDMDILKVNIHDNIIHTIVGRLFTM